MKLRLTCLVCGRKWVGDLELVARPQGCFSVYHKKPCPDCGQIEIQISVYAPERG